MASALATPPILAPSSIASCTARACLARARCPMTPSRSRKTAMLWAPVHPALRLRMSVALALTHPPPRPTLARPWRAPGRRTYGRRPAPGSFRPRRCASPEFHPACVATRPRPDSPSSASKPRVRLESRPRPDSPRSNPNPNEGGLGGRLLPHGPRARLHPEL